MGSTIGQDAELTERTARWVKEAASRVPVSIKVTPLVADLPHIAHAVQKSGADAITAINTVKSLIGVDIDNFVPYPIVDGKSSYGGYSGAAIKPISLRCVAEIAKAVNMPISATGGITTWRDAVEFLLCGARNLQVCTAAMKHGFRIIEDLTDGLSVYLEDKGMSSVEELVGLALPNIVEHSHLSRIQAVSKSTWRPVSIATSATLRARTAGTRDHLVRCGCRTDEEKWRRVSHVRQRLSCVRMLQRAPSSCMSLLRGR